jgi:hypothetical protein
MLRYFNAILLLFLFDAAILAQENIIVTSQDHFERIIYQPVAMADSAHLIFSDFDFDYSRREYRKHDEAIKAWAVKQTILSISFENIEDLRGSFVNWLLNHIRKNPIRELSIKGGNIEDDLVVYYALALPYMHTINIKNVRLNKDFFIKTLHQSVPSLTTLRLINCQLDEDIVDNFRSSGILSDLKELNLSENEFSNSIFAVFPYSESGKIETLILNNCGLTLQKNADYNNDFLAINRFIADEKPHVRWGAPYFTNLRHLEIQNGTEHFEECLAYINDTTFHHLDIFLGFQLAFPKSNSEKREKINEQKRDEYFAHIVSLPFRSRRNNYVFETPKKLNKFLNSYQTQFTEHLLLVGSHWNIWAVETVLQSKKLPDLKELTLIATPLTQDELMHIIQAYPKISIEGVFKKTGLHWPRMYREY